MTSMAQKVLAEARTAREARNDATRIFSRINEAKQSPAGPGVRWPFELIQNAHDAGPIEGLDAVDINFILNESTLTVSHNGKPFTGDELAALLSGGSSKEFTKEGDDEETTGRFGTGFLVTHALSTLVDLASVITTPEDLYRFDMRLARDGDIESIIENIKEADASLGNATPISEDWIKSHPTAKFMYRQVDGDVALRGLDRLQGALPYLYATCQRLGKVCVMIDDAEITFNRGQTTEFEINGFCLTETEVVISDCRSPKTMVVVRVGDKDAKSALLILVENNHGRRRLMLPDANFPKLFVTFPITDATFLPFNFLLDGEFMPRQERDRILMTSRDKCLISSAFAALPALVQHAVENRWEGAHHLAELKTPDGTFDPTDSIDEQRWWTTTVRETAKEIASRPIIDASGIFLPALHTNGIQAVSFLVPSINADTDDCIDYDVFHDLVANVTSLRLPTKSIASEWGQIAHDWSSIGIQVERFGLEELTEKLKDECTSVNDLPVRDDKFSWLADLMAIAAAIDDRNVEDMVNGLLPNQRGVFVSTRSDYLYTDDGVSEEVKNIADSVGLDLREQLLHGAMHKALRRHGHEGANELAETILYAGGYSENRAIDDVLEQIEKTLQGGGDFNDSIGMTAIRASARLATHLANSEDMQRLRQCPLLTTEETISHLTNSQILSPVAHWPNSAQPYHSLYTGRRILSDLYYTDDTLKACLGPLIAEGLVIPAPIYEARRSEITEANLLNSMNQGDQSIDGITVRNALFTQIAFLSPDLVNRAGNDPDTAALLIEFVLNVAAREDGSWQEMRQVNATRAGEAVQLSLPRGIWPFELKVKSWIPVPLSEDSKDSQYGQAPTTADNLQRLYDPTLLRDNPGAVALLESVFGFEKLTLMLASLEPEDENDLVTLLENPGLVQSMAANPEAAGLVANASPEQLNQMKEQLDEQKRQAELSERNRRFGLSAQEALADALRRYNLDVDLVDRGYDYDVSPGSPDDALDAASWRFEVDKYLLEVKATTTGDVRLTPLQAETASTKQDQFILCVIDLQGQAPKAEWVPSEIVPFAKIVTDVGSVVDGVFADVENLTDSDNQIRLRNEQMLRYGVSQSLWRYGMSIDDWVQTLKTD